MTEAIHGKMAAILRDVDAIGKNARNQAQGFNYRGIDDVYNALNPVLAKHGVYMTAKILGKTREERTNAKGTVLAFTSLHMRYRFIAEDGSFAETEVEGEGMDSGDKSSNKAMAIAHKYALLQAFCIPTKDLVDPDADVHEVAPKAPAPNGNGRHAEMRGDPGPKPDDTLMQFLKGKKLTILVPGAKAGKPNYTAWAGFIGKAVNACEDVRLLERLWADNADQMLACEKAEPNLAYEVERNADQRRADLTPPTTLAAE